MKVKSSSSSISFRRRPQAPDLPFAHHVESITRNIEAAQDVAYGALDVLKTRLVTFDEFDASIRDALLDNLEADGDYLDANKMLAQVNCERTILERRQGCEAFIAELFLEEDETVEAERYVNRASQFIHECPDVVIKTKHRVSHARILTSKQVSRGCQ